HAPHHELPVTARSPGAFRPTPVPAGRRGVDLPPGRRPRTPPTPIPPTPLPRPVMRRTLVGRLAVVAAAVAAAADPPAGYKLEQTVPVKGDGGWDYLSVDPAGRRVYVSHATTVEVLDADTGELKGRIPDT